MPKGVGTCSLNMWVVDDPHVSRCIENAFSAVLRQWGFVTSRTPSHTFTLRSKVFVKRTGEFGCCLGVCKVNDETLEGSGRPLT